MSRGVTQMSPCFPCSRPHVPLTICSTNPNPRSPRLQEILLPGFLSRGFLRILMFYLFVAVTRHLCLPRWIPGLDLGRGCPPQTPSSHTTLSHKAVFPGNPKLPSVFCTLSLGDLIGLMAFKCHLFANDFTNLRHHH